MGISQRLLVSVLLSGHFVSPAFAAVDVNAPVVQLLKTCTAPGGAIIDNCFENSFLLAEWMANVRKPNKASPLKVDIGPGEYTNTGYLILTCDPASGYTGYTAFKGAGTVNTVVETGFPPVVVNNCTQLEFSSYKIVTSYNYITWNGGGESRWRDMEIETAGGAWREDVCGSERGKHYWYSSKLSFGAAGNGGGYTANCDETWFFGSQIAYGGQFYAHPGGRALAASGPGEIHVYGGNIRGQNILGNNSGLIEVANGGKVHIHGTGIDLIPGPSATGTASIFEAASGGTIHANTNAYAVDFSTGAAISRITELGGSVTAPYNWGALQDPPSVTSKTGSDTVVETDCSLTKCDNLGSQPHTLVYDSSCGSNPGGPWLDTATLSCRGE